ncbi:ParB/RepB/Spo0J family partition protein [Edaphobacter sp.]|uniref:ParB/RepB/Spo0J family partition protein n=1 Tax=Edaphobacter sp. TaxID=1934404 RepID=UPI002DBE429D|nr:ParB/RepB/Spo0J family partition protein [Edaphobacter sp.]HEU5340416.1 ParB/RepB/Spo0J family partition protein [Edaphobacter sp.]
MATATQETKHDPKRRALGKGLESLLPARPAVVGQIQAQAAESAGKPMEIPLDQIDRNPFQTRSHFDEAQLNELAQSISASGVVQPIVVKRVTSGRYQLITGERRWLASQKAGKQTIPAVIRQVSDEQTLEMTIVENLQRADLNPIEQAHAFQRLSQEFQLTQEQIAIRTGKERASVGNFVRLLRLPEGLQKKVETGELSFGHARAILALDTHEAMTQAAQKVMALSLSVRQTESYIQGLINPEAKPLKKDEKPAQPEDPNVREAQEQLQRRLGLKVRIEDKRGKGKVIIEYANIEDFDAILGALAG